MYIKGIGLLKKFISLTIKANEKIYKLIQKSSHKKLCKDIKIGAGGDMGHFIDVKSEQIFIKYLHKFGQIISEEIGIYGENSQYKIIIDPCDGSDNFVSKLPYFGSSVALSKDGKYIAGIVCNFANKDIFIKTEKYFKKGKLFSDEFVACKVNKFSKVGIFERAYCSKKYVKKFQELNIKFRSSGALALSLAYAHEVDFVFYEGDAREFDIASGWYMCEHLYKIKTKNYIFVSKDKQTFDKILKKILKAR